MSEHSSNGPVTRSAKKKAEEQRSEIQETKVKEFETFVQQHPLLIPVILKVLFKYPFLPEDLKRLRLVCRCWFEASLKQWRSRAIVNLSAKSIDVPKQLEVFKYTKYLKTSKDVYQFAKHPFQQYVIRGMDLRSTNMNNLAERYDTCWTLMGPLIKTLRFEDCAFGDPNTFQKILTKKLVNLESLSIGRFKNVQEGSSNAHDSSYYRDFYRISKSNGQNFNLTNLKLVCEPLADLVLLFSAPNIKVLTIFSQMYCDWPGLYSVLREISDAKAHIDQEQFKIKELNLNLHISKIENVVLLRRPINLSVERVFFCIQTLSSGIICFEPGFQNLHTLRSLELCKLFKQGRLIYKIARNGIAHLKELYLYSFCFTSLETVNHLTKLETLYIDIRMYNCLDRVVEATCKPIVVAKLIELSRFQVIEDIITKMNPDNLSSLIALKHFHVDQELQVDSWRIVSEWMPHLETLETVLGPIGFQSVCRHLPNLKGLVLLHGSKIGDKVLTGVTATDRNPDNITAFAQLQTFQVQRFCGILSCGTLRGPPSCRLGDQSVYRGFLEMKNLQDVSIHVSQKMSIETETLLREHIPNVQVIRSYINSKNNHTSECCKVKDFLKHYYQKC